MLKIFSLLGSGFAFLCTTLVLSQLVIVSVLWGRGFLSSEKIHRLQAVYTDVDYQKIRSELVQQQEQAENDPVKLASTEVMLTRTTAINRLADDVALAEVRLRESGRRFELVEEAFANEVRRLEEEIISSTRLQLMNTLKNMDSAQTKDSLVGIVKDGGLDDVIAVLREMNKSERSKVFAEFQSEEESQMLAEILKSIRE